MVRIKRVMKGISQREFAKRDKCSPTLVRKALQSGALKAFEDGSLDPALVGTPWRVGNFEPHTPARNVQDFVSFAEARRLKEAALAELRQLEVAERRGKLVNADIVRAEVFKLARVERDALQNLPARIAPLIAAKLGV